MNKLSLAVICALGLGMTAVSAEEADVVVVGSGGAGLSAAVTAAQAGKNVIVLEKNADYRRQHAQSRRRYECRRHAPAA